MSVPPDPLASFHFRAAGRLRVGTDLVQVSRIADSLAQLGERFVTRLFTPDEAAYARAAPVHTAQRLAARFAAKEAAIKAFGLAEVGVDWRDIEVCRASDGAVSLALHGRAAAHARHIGVEEAALSLSHEGAYATAVVTVWCGVG